MTEDLFKFDMQLFAEGGDDSGDDGDDGADNQNDHTGDGADAGKKDEADFQSKLKTALAAEKQKWEKDYQKKAAAAKKEAERLSKLSDDERAKAELESNRQELVAKEQELKKKELKLEMVGVLAERSIPVQFMDYLIAEDNESTLKRITDFEKAYKKAVEAGVNERLKGKTPKAGGTAGKTADNAGVKNGFFDAIYKNQTKR